MGAMPAHDFDEPVGRPTAMRFATGLGRLWRALGRRSDPDLSRSERLLLESLPTAGVSLMWVAERLELAKSSASVTVKALERRGLVTRARDPFDERKLAIVLTAEGRRRVRHDTVLDLDLVAATLNDLPVFRRYTLVRLLEQLAERAERVPRRWP